MSGPDKAAGRFSNIQSAESNSDSNETLFVDETDSLYSFVEVTGVRWNKLYPYQLIVVEKTESGWKKSSEGWQFTLPISPQALELDMPFSITTSATLGGIVEEHNGAPFRMINFSGTTGVLPLKGAPDVVPGFNIAQSVFAGTVNAAATVTSDIQRSSIISDAASNIVPDTEFNSPVSSINKTSGYYQWHQLRQLFEIYAQKKKTVDGRKLRLAFAMWKDESVYLVTPLSFKTSRDGGSPYEYRYNLALKAWARIKLDSSFEPDSHAPIGRDPNALAKMVAALQVARTAIEGTKNIIKAAVGDIENTLLTPLREIQLAAKGIAGIALTLADLPGNVITDSKEAVTSIRKEFNDLKNVPDAIKSKIQSLSTVSNKASLGAGRIQTTASALEGAHPVNKVFANPADNFDVFSKIDPAKIKLPLNVQRKITEEKQRVAKLTRKDFEIRRDSIVSVMVDFAEAIGMGNATFNAIYSIKPRTTSAKVATEEDLNILFNLNNIVTEVNKLCVSNKIDPDQTSAIEFIAGLARKSSISFTEPRSKFLVPFLSGHTLEEMALRYLGDANRWHEIAALNGLREPYIDETGFDVFLMVNGKDSSIQVSDITNLFVGQFVYISSSTVRPEKRKITGLNKVTDGVYLVTLSGDPDLVKFQLNGQAKIHAYLPDTVNSQMSIYIPSQDDPQLEDFLVKPIQGVDYFDNLVRVGGISLLLNANNDIIFSPDGRSRLAVGLNNIIQKARIALSTPKGSLLQHPGYGLPVQVGDSTADVSADNVLKSIQDMFSRDPSFSSVTSAAVKKTGGTTSITINVGITGTSQIIPITTEIRR